MQSFFTQTRFIVCGLLAMVCALSTGCATSKYGEQITTINYYPQCYAPIQDLRDADTDFNRTVGISTGLGVLGGALIGFLTTGKVQGALVGAAAGGVAGAGLGYAKAKQDRIADDNQRMASYLVDLEGDISGIDRATAAARTARDCYNRQFRQAIADYKAGRMQRAELSGRYSEIKNGCSEADAILGVVIAAADDKERDYQQAVQAESQRAGVAVPAVAASPAKPAASAAASRTKTKPGASSAGATASTTAGRTGSTAQSNKPVVSQTVSPMPAGSSLEAMAAGTQRLGDSKQSAIDERESMRKMQEEMDGMLATVLS